MERRLYSSCRWDSMPNPISTWTVYQTGIQWRYLLKWGKAWRILEQFEDVQSIIVASESSGFDSTPRTLLRGWKWLVGAGGRGSASGSGAACLGFGGGADSGGGTRVSTCLDLRGSLTFFEVWTTGFVSSTTSFTGSDTTGWTSFGASGCSTTFFGVRATSDASRTFLEATRARFGRSIWDCGFSTSDGLEESTLRLLLRDKIFSTAFASDSSSDEARKS